MRAWEQDGAVDGNPLATRKDAIRHAVKLSLRERSGRSERMR